MKTSATFDIADALNGLDKLGAIGYKLARSMGVAAGEALRDEAKLRAPVGKAEDTAAGGGSIVPGSLRNAIYLAFRDKDSTNVRVKYSVSWSAKKAPHGHLLEFGHWQPYTVVLTKNGWRTTTSFRAGGPKRIPAFPFLRPAYESLMPRLRSIMVDRGRARFPELIRDQLIPESSV